MENESAVYCSPQPETCGYPEKNLSILGHRIIFI